MKIENEKLQYLFSIIKATVVDALEKLNEYNDNNSYCPKYYKYPHPFWQRIKQTDTYGQLILKCPQIKYGVEEYDMNTYDNPNNYEELFGLKDDKFRINITNSNKFNELCEFFNKNNDIVEIMYGNTKEIQYKTCKFIAQIVNRLMYIGQEEKEIDKLIVYKLRRYFNEKLSINICVPINFILFSEEKIELADNITIERIPDEMQISRFYFSQYDSKSENNVLQNCAYMIILKNYTFDNDNNSALESLKKNYWAYPIEKIDDILVSIRIVTGLDIGYSQILMQPINWVDDTCTDMVPIYGTTIRAFNRKFTDMGFIQYEYAMINTIASEKIKNVYNFIINVRNKDVEQQEKLKLQKTKTKFRNNRYSYNKEIPYNKIFIAIKKLNKCMLREEDDDMALEAIIGIETLLSDSQSALKYTMSNRLAIISSQIDECNYNPDEMRKAMKYMYSLRSRIVHGEYVEEKDKIVKVGTNIVQFKNLAIEFLRYSLLFILSNEEYLNPACFEKLLDNLLIKAKKNML